MKFCLHKYFSVYDVVNGRNILMFRKCFKCGKVKKLIKTQILYTVVEGVK